MRTSNKPSSSRKRKRDILYRRQSKSYDDKSSDGRTPRKEESSPHPLANPDVAVPPRRNDEVKPKDVTSQKHRGHSMPLPRTSTVSRLEKDSNNNMLKNNHQQQAYHHVNANTTSNSNGRTNQPSQSQQNYAFQNLLLQHQNTQFGNLIGQPAAQDAQFQASASSSFSQRNNSSTPPGRNNEEAGPKLIPCKAHGMPEDPNNINAYFTIPNTIKHADELFCSHPACQREGPRFIYCKFCEVPVAKQYFRQHHSHLEIMYPDPRLALAAQEAMAHGNYVVGQQENDNDDVQISEGAARIQASSPSCSPSPSRHPEKAKEQLRWEWENLLYERPYSEEGDGMSSWLMKVTALSGRLLDTFGSLDDGMDDTED